MGNAHFRVGSIRLALVKKETLIVRSGFLVELEGIEPSSKQGTNMLSTCLFCY
jgi:hypothetical protein